MKISKPARREAKALLRYCLVEGTLADDRVRQTVRKVIELRPRGYQAILSHFQRLVKLEVKQRTALVESAAPLTDEVRASVCSNLERLYPRGLAIEFKESPQLIAGLKVQVGSDVFDGSIATRLNKLSQGF